MYVRIYFSDIIGDFQRSLLTLSLMLNKICKMDTGISLLDHNSCLCLLLDFSLLKVTAPYIPKIFVYLQFDYLCVCV